MTKPNGWTKDWTYSAKSEFKSIKAEDLAKDARIAELTAEVARYKDAIERIVENVDTSTNVQAYAQFCAYIARNALKEGM